MNDIVSSKDLFKPFYAIVEEKNNLLHKCEELEAEVLLSRQTNEELQRLRKMRRELDEDHIQLKRTVEAGVLELELYKSETATLRQTIQDLQASLHTARAELIEVKESHGIPTVDVRVKCECGVLLSKSSLYKHRNSVAHKVAMERHV